MTDAILERPNQAAAGFGLFRSNPATMPTKRKLTTIIIIWASVNVLGNRTSWRKER